MLPAARKICRRSGKIGNPGGVFQPAPDEAIKDTSKRLRAAERP